MNLPNKEEAALDFSDFAGDKNEPEVMKEPEATPVKEVAAAIPAIIIPKAEPNKNPVQIVAKDSGLLVGGNLEEQWRLATMFHKGRMLPAAYDSPEKIMTAMQLCYEMNLPFLSSIRQIAIIKGTPSFFGNLPLAIVERSNQMEYRKEYLIDKSGKKMCVENGNFDSELGGAVCITKRKGYAEAEPSIFTVKDAIKAKVWDTNVWAVYPKIMFKMRARSMNLKDNYADILNGISIAEYDHNVIPESAEEAITTTGGTIGDASTIKALLGDKR